MFACDNVTFDDKVFVNVSKAQKVKTARIARGLPTRTQLY
jgi:hypothetical protein